MIFNRQCWFVTVKILRNLRRLFALLTVFSAEEDHHADVVNAISSQMSSLGASWDSDSDLQNINEQQLHSSLKINQRKNILLCVRCVQIYQAIEQLNNHITVSIENVSCCKLSRRLAKWH